MVGPTPLTVARVAHVQWFFVTLYEAVVRMPDRLVDEHDSGRRSTPFAPGSPARYHLPIAPVVVGSALTALVDARRNDRDRAALTVAATSSVCGAALTGYLVRTVNLRMLTAGPPIGADERGELVRRWHRVNRARLVLLAVAAVALERAGS